MKLKFKKDSFRNARKGYSKILEVRCGKCENPICSYQKDGRGSLMRLYFDRIISPEYLKDLQKIELSKISTLRCGKCGEVIGVPYIYSKENRKAFRLYQDAVIKKITKA